MYQPETYGMALVFMLLSMFCWGSWANTMKAARGFPFQLFYWDYVIGVVLASLGWGFTLGSFGGGVQSFISDLTQADRIHIVYGLAGGVVFNVANLLLVAAIEIAGLAVAFPIGIGLALVEGSLLNYVLSPKGSPLLLFGGVAFVLVAIVLDSVAYRMREASNRQISRKGVWISFASGILMGLFYPLVVEASTGRGGLGPYSIAFVFALGVAACSIPANYLFMVKPLTGGRPVAFPEFFRARPSWHFWGILGGAIWCTGMVMNFAASHAQLIGPAVSYSIGQGATMVSALWGIFVWHEFANAPRISRILLGAMFLCFVIGLLAVGSAPLFP
jgi:glucose uptake protein